MSGHAGNKPEMNEPRPLLAAAWMIGAIFSFSAMAVAGRYASAELDTFEIMTYRSFLGLATVLGIAAVFGRLGEINTRKLHLHFLRNIFHFTGQNLWFYALTVIPMAQLIALEFTSPLWVIVLAPIFLSERVSAVRWFAALLGFSGILAVARPEIGALNSGVLAGAACAVGFAGTTIFTKILTRTASITCILFYLTLMQWVFGLAAAGYDGDIAWPSPVIWPWVCVVAAGGLAAHFSITKALTLAPATIVGPVDFARLPLIALLGFVLFGERVDIFLVLGAAMILTANIINMRAEARDRAKLRDLA
jgi:drug/metabolite transporter (DMT)-like permease